MKETEKCTITLPRGWATKARNKHISLSGILRNGLAPRLDLTEEEIKRYGSVFSLAPGRKRK